MLFYIIAILLVAADQIFKFVIVKEIPFNHAIEVIPGFFELTNWRNTGAAWGMFPDNTIILAIISLLASLFVIYIIPKAKAIFFKISLSLILAGAVGNLIDRVRLRYVVDYLSFDIFGYKFPVFNLADICIVIGCILMMIFVLFIHKENMVLFEKPIFPFIKGKKNQEIKNEGAEEENNVQ